MVNVIEATNRQRAIASLTLAFSCDPVMRWGWPDPEQYLTIGRRSLTHRWQSVRSQQRARPAELRRHRAVAPAWRRTRHRDSHGTHAREHD
jgi:hypothetical protein